MYHVHSESIVLMYNLYIKHIRFWCVCVCVYAVYDAYKAFMNCI